MTACNSPPAPKYTRYIEAKKQSFIKDSFKPRPADTITDSLVLQVSIVTCTLYSS